MTLYRRDNSKKGYSKVKKTTTNSTSSRVSSKKKSSRSSSSSSRNPSTTKSTLSATVFDAKTGKKKGFLVNGKIVKELPKKTPRGSGGSGRSRPKTPVTVTITDTKSGVETKRVIDPSTGKTLSKSKRQAITQTKIPGQKRTTQQNIAQINELMRQKAISAAVGERLLRDRGRVAVNVEGDTLMVPIETTRDKKKRELELKKFNKKVLTGVTNRLNQVQNSPKFKALTKQSITPKELKALERQLLAENYTLEQKQIKLLKNAPKSIGLAVYEFGKDIVTLPIVAVEGAYKYGLTASARANKKGESVLKVFKRDAESIGNSAVKIGRFIKNNPLESFAIASAAATQLGKSSKKSFFRDPIKFTARTLLEVFSGTVLLKTAKVTRLDKLGKLVPERYVNNKFELTTSSKGKDKIVGVLEGIDKLGNDFKGTYKLRKEGDKFVGSIEYKSGGKVRKERIELIDKGNHYFNTVTKEKIPKKLTKLTERKITVKETTLTPKSKAKAVIVKGNPAVSKTFDVQTVITKNIVAANKKTQKIITKVRDSTVQFVEAKINSKLKTKRFARSVQNTKSIVKKYSKKPFELSKSQIKSLQDFFDLVDWDKVVVGGLDKRKRVAKALGLSNKTILDTLKQLRKTPKGTKKVVTIKKSGKGEVTIGEKPKPFEIKLGGPFVGKKATLGGSKSVTIVKRPITVKKNIGGKLGREVIEIPVLRVPTKLPTGFNKILKASQLTGRFRDVLRKQDRFFKDARKGILTTKQLQKFKQDNKKEIERIQKKIKDVDTDKIKDQEKAQKPKQVTKSKTVKRAIKPKVKISAITVKPPKAPKKPKKLKKLTFDSELPRGENLKFNAKYKEKGRIKTLKLGLPKNKALARVGNLADTTTQRSIEIFIVGTTKAKDIGRPPVLSKFRPKISSNRQVLKLVEKSKNTIDTKGEKQKLSISRKLAKQKKKNGKQSRSRSKRSVRKV